MYVMTIWANQGVALSFAAIALSWPSAMRLHLNW
jgi:hypothetical protein